MSSKQKVCPQQVCPVQVKDPHDEETITPSSVDSTSGIRATVLSNSQISTLKLLSERKKVFAKSEHIRISLRQLIRCNTYQLEQDAEPDPSKVIGRLGAVFALVQSALGSGILALPFALSQTGIPLGFFLMIFALLLNGYSSVLLIKIGQALGRRNFERMTIVTCGPSYARFLNIVLVVDALLKVIGLHVICKNLLPHALKAIIGVENLAPILSSTYFWGTVLTLCFFYPLALIRNLKILQYMGLVGFTATLYFVFLVAIEFFRLVEPQQREQNFNSSMKFNFQTGGVFSALPIFIYSFSFQINVPTVNFNMERRSTGRMVTSVSIVFIVLFSIYVIFGSFGVMTQAHEEEFAQNILRAEVYQPLLQFQIGFLIYVVMLTMASLFRFRVAKNAIQELVWKNKPMQGKGNLLLTLGLTLGCMILELVVPQIVILIQIIGSTTTPLVCFISPIIYYIKIRDNRASCGVIFAYIILLTITTSSLFSLYSSLYNFFFQ